MFEASCSQGQAIARRPVYLATHPFGPQPAGERQCSGVLELALVAGRAQLQYCCGK
jgi:hypothetical protein